MTSRLQPFEESLRRTLLRTIVIAFVVGGAIALMSRKWSTWPLATLLVMWPSFGGHWVEVCFLNWLRPRISPAPGVQAVTRVLVWFAGGTLLALGMRLTGSVVIPGRSAQWLPWWLGGVAFIGVELVVHLVMRGRGLPNFYSGRG